MSETKSDGYGLPRNPVESARLEQQHRLLVQNIGFLLHPRIEGAGPPNDAHIGDIATGTGVWLKELSKTCPPSWKMTGMDISDAQFPLTRQGQRIQFDILNILEPIPDKWKNAFDVVHIRLLVLALGTDDYKKVAENAFQMLKPGGWIQWQEHSIQPGKVVQSVPGASRTYLTKLRATLAAMTARSSKMLPEDVLRRPSLLETAGFQDTNEDVFHIDRDASTREEYTGQTTRAVISILRGAIKADPSLATEEEIADWGAKALEECKNAKAYVAYTTHIVTGQKPL